MRCVFCEIATGETPASVVYSDERYLAFLDATPLFYGHTLLIPRAHVETLLDVDPADIGPLFQRTHLLAAAVQEACGAQGTFVALNNKVSQSVPHLHVHIVPRTKGDGLKGFFWPRKKYASDEQREEVAESIRRVLKRAD